MSMIYTKKLLSLNNANLILFLLVLMYYALTAPSVFSYSVLGLYSLFIIVLFAFITTFRIYVSDSEIIINDKFKKRSIKYEEIDKIEFSIDMNSLNLYMKGDNQSVLLAGLSNADCLLNSLKQKRDFPILIKGYEGESC